ncbi:unnamed protein product [Gongylonema pulchrum]|uniref:Uncharacterized protein n=1 Tax=Gongylonema pulchrum TaxID=637853 RepID=A0A183EFC4_9BILA|nr:unnamed protein product [Gongylonema pulchrum]
MKRLFCSIASSYDGARQRSEVNVNGDNVLDANQQKQQRVSRTIERILHLKFVKNREAMDESSTSTSTPTTPSPPDVEKSKIKRSASDVNSDLQNDLEFVCYLQIS